MKNEEITTQNWKLKLSVYRGSRKVFLNGIFHNKHGARATML